jgi:hypothetical protein
MRQCLSVRLILEIIKSNPYTRRFLIYGQPPQRGFGRKGAIFFHCASVSNGPDRAIGPRSALLTAIMLQLKNPIHRHFSTWNGFMEQR